LKLQEVIQMLFKRLALSTLIFSGLGLIPAEVQAEETLRAPHSKAEQRKRLEHKTRGQAPCLSGVRQYIFQAARTAHSKTQTQQAQKIDVRCDQAALVKQQETLRMPHSKAGMMRWMKQRHRGCQTC